MKEPHLPSPFPGGSSSFVSRMRGLFLQGVVWALGLRLLSRVLLFLSQWWLIRQWRPEVYGAFAVGWSLFRLFYILAPVGMDEGLLRFASPLWPRREALRPWVLAALLSTAGVAGGLALLVATGVYLGAYGFDVPTWVHLLPAFALAGALAALLRVAAAATRISQRVLWSLVSEDLVPGLLFLGWVLLLVKRDQDLLRSVQGLHLAWGLGLLLALGGAFRRLGWSRLDLGQLPWRDLWNYSWPIFASMIFLQLSLWGDRWVVGQVLSLADVGYYHAAAQLALLTLLLLNAFNVPLGPQMAHTFSRHPQHLPRLFAWATQALWWVLFPGAVLLGIYGDVVLRTLYGPAYTVATPVLRILTVGFVIRVAFGPAPILLRMTGASRTWFRITALTFGLHILLLLFLLPRWGITGAALALSIVLGSQGLLAFMAATRHVGQRLYHGPFLQTWVLALVALSAMLAVRLGVPFRFWPVHGGVALALWMGFGIALLRNRRFFKHKQEGVQAT